jgi:hypothetical protein
MRDRMEVPAGCGGETWKKKATWKT